MRLKRYHQVNAVSLAETLLKTLDLNVHRPQRNDRTHAETLLRAD